VFFDSVGNYFITDTSNNRVRRVDGVTTIITTVAGMTYFYGYNGDTGPGIAAQLNHPEEVILGVPSLKISTETVPLIRPLSGYRSAGTTE